MAHALLPAYSDDFLWSLRYPLIDTGSGRPVGVVGAPRWPRAPVASREVVGWINLNGVLLCCSGAVLRCGCVYSAIL